MPLSRMLSHTCSLSPQASHLTLGHRLPWREEGWDPALPESVDEAKGWMDGSLGTWKSGGSPGGRTCLGKNGWADPWGTCTPHRKPQRPSVTSRTGCPHGTSASLRPATPALTQELHGHRGQWPGLSFTKAGLTLALLYSGLPTTRQRPALTSSVAPSLSAVAVGWFQNGGSAWRLC